MRAPRTLSLRAKFVLVVLFGGVVPLGVVGLWLTRTAERSGEELLRERLERTLAQIVEEIGLRWVQYRSDLLDLAEHPVVQQPLRDGGSRRSEPDSVLPEELRQSWATVQPYVRRVVVRDAAGVPRRTFAQQAVGGRLAVALNTAFLRVELGIYETASGDRLGTLEAWLLMSSLIPSGAGWVGVGGSVLAIFHATDGTPLLPLTIDPDLFRQSRFEWSGEPWVGMRRLLGEPPLELVLAAPVGPFQEPFAVAARRGTIALVVVAVAGLLLVTWLTGRLTRSLGQLAVAADAVSRGELDRQVAEGAGDEVGRVARAFNHMTASLRDTLRQLSQRESLAAVGEFAASLAHEIRNSLSSIRLDLQLLEEEGPDAKTSEVASRTLRLVKRLDATVTSSLRLARSGLVAHNPLDLRVPIEAAVQTARPEFLSRGARLESLKGAEDPICVTGDATALEQVLLNLLLNAAQGLEAGGQAGVTVESDDHHVSVTVWDTGTGISDEALQKVFDPFFTTKAEGTGLGLAIARRIVQGHGGAISIDSAVGEGTSVLVRLPLAPADPRTSST